MFSTLAGAVIGFGSLGNLASAAPMAWAVEVIGWRETMWALAAVTLVVAVALWIFLKDPPRSEGASQKGSVLDLLRIPALWLILPMMFVNYAPAAGVRGLWAGPYSAEVFGADTALIGTVTLVMGLAMIASSFLYGPADRFFGSTKWVVFAGNGAGAAACFALWLFPMDGSIWAATALLAVIGVGGSSFPVLIAHGRKFFPEHLTGRGVTLLNLFGIGGVGVMQVVTGRLMEHWQVVDPKSAFNVLFGFYGLLICCGLAVYAFSRDPAT